MPVPALPGSVDESMVTPPNGDVSVALFDKIIGPGWEKLVYAGQDNVTEAGTLFGYLLGLLNVVTLTALTIMLIYMAAIGVVGTGHDGQPLGKRYHSSWVPIRAGTSVAFLTPLPWAGGFSLMQATLLLMLYFGIGFAGYLERQATGYLEKHSGRIAAVEVPGNSGEVVSNILSSLVLQRYLVEAEGHAPPKDILRWDWTYRSTDLDTQADIGGGTRENGGTFNLVHEDDRKDGQWIGYFQPTIPDGPSRFKKGDFGFIRIYCPRKDLPSCKARADAASSLVKDLVPTAKAIVTHRMGKEAGTENLGPHKDRVILASHRFYKKLADLQESDLRAMDARRSSWLKDVKTRLDHTGWVSLGAWYWNIARFQEQYAESTGETPISYSPRVDSSAIVDFSEYGSIQLLTARFMSDVAGILSRGESSVGDNADISVSSSRSDKGEIMQQITEISNKVSSWLTRKLMEGDAMANLEAFGSSLVNVSYVAIGAGVAAYLVGGAAKGEANSPVGWLGSLLTLGGVSAGGEVASRLGVLALVGLGLFAVVLFVVGLLFAFWLPAIPLIQWWTGVVSWVILSLEVLVAAPLWAFAHGWPDGEGFAGDRAKQGYMLFARLLLMPALMVISMFLAIQIVNPLLTLLGGFVVTFMTSLGSGVIGPFGLIVMLLILLTLAVGTADRVFGLVTWLPNNLLNWLGQLKHGLGDEAEARRHIGMIAGYVRSGVPSGVSNRLRAADAKRLAGKSGGAGGGSGGAGGSGGGQPGKLPGKNGRMITTGGVSENDGD